jgi:hypothetical protein
MVVGLIVQTERIMFRSITKPGWFRHALTGLAFVGAGILALGATSAPAQAQYYPYYGYPYYYGAPYAAYYPYYGYPYGWGYGYPLGVRVGWGWGWHGGWHGGGWHGGWHGGHHHR